MPVQKKSRLPGGIWALGFVSLLMDVSSEMVHGLLPVFLISVLGASYTTVGLIEGFGEATAVALRVISGPFSDWIRRRKPLVFVGYTMGALSKPLFALAETSGLVFGARIFDRVGKGIRAAPRDALISEIAPAEIRGEAFGLRQSLDTLGAVIGPLLAILIMALSMNNYRLVFWLALIPGLLCVVLIIFGVREPESSEDATSRKRDPIFSGVRELPSAFWLIALVSGISQLARFSEAFLILRATDQGLSLSLSPLVLISMNAVYSLSAYPLGWLSDRWPREKMVAWGFFILTLADLVLALGTNLLSTFVGVALWGLHMGLTQGTLAALVADHSPRRFRGTAFGIFNLFSAGALLVASVFAGSLWDRFGASTTFLVGASLSFVGALVLLAVKKYIRHEVAG